MPDKRPNALIIWCRLLRLPNIFTVPGDALAGALLSTHGQLSPAVGWAALAVIPLYLGGLALNDYFDRKEDAEERPGRPIPAGHVAASTVLITGVGLVGTGVAISFLLCNTQTGYVSLGLAGCILAYDIGGRKIPLLGPILMGACRAGSVLLGAFAVGGPTEWAIRAVMIAWAYTVAITIVAARETDEEPPKKLIYLPTIFLGMVSVMVLRLDQSASRFPSAMLLLWGMSEAFLGARTVATGKKPVPALIGRLIRVMLTIQTAWIMMAFAPDKFLLSMSLLVFLLLKYAAEWASRRFYGS
jgi:4-hydroxybenzoate polyprenyltransferase